MLSIPTKRKQAKQNKCLLKEYVYKLVMFFRIKSCGFPRIFTYTDDRLFKFRLGMN